MRNFYRVLSEAHPAGVLKPPEWLTMKIMAAVERDGEWWGPCPCCGRRIKVREAEREHRPGAIGVAPSWEKQP